MILKPNMILPGLNCLLQQSVEEIADATVNRLLLSVPSEVLAIAFLSGGQPADFASLRLSVMNQNRRPRLPWILSFSYSRAILQHALQIWKADPANVPKAQQALFDCASKTNWPVAESTTRPWTLTDISPTCLGWSLPSQRSFQPKDNCVRTYEDFSMDSRSQIAHAMSTVVGTTPEVSPEKYDLVIIGSGTAAKLSAWTLGKLGWRIAIIERQYIGGACNNIACLPSKNLIYTAQISSYTHRLKEFGMEATNLTVNMSGVRERKRQMVNGEIEGDSNLFRLTGGELILGVGRMVGPKLVEVLTNEGKRRLLKGNQILIGTGSRAVIDETPGLRESNPLTHIEALELGTIPDHLVILGAGYVGLEFAQAMKRLGSKGNPHRSGRASLEAGRPGRQ
jgi:Fructose-bisphosphate aldolase class-I/Pyridine nucleotide-disulphide oxidoreductase